ncbi:hypothetical protein P22_2674 [Propionispora sp. 2/2-37]|uniref:DUF445 domain-containing protein n=1 Tax=Propionispora sp. 2/2-37 TaxID=1677858 RepID=UPI0006BB5C92|nr:DUF445 domain-containing protein [Propionispora sp. 2/2-37]CUH96584.1 hypothetical protein P22_2674 [Propionispora sp. 2/2-37]
MSNIRFGATAALGLATLGYFVSYPYSTYFYGGLINSGCWAAMVGGLADWFAVTALFRKPLGFSYRTAIIPQNRERIFRELVAFVEDDLLTTDNIRHTLSRYGGASGLLIRYLEESPGKQHSRQMLHTVLQLGLQQLDAHIVGRLLADLLRQHAGQISLSPITAHVLAWTIQRGYDEQIINFLLDELDCIVGQRENRKILQGLFAEVGKGYERGTKRHKFVSWLLDLLSDRLVDSAEARIHKILRELKSTDHPLRHKLKTWLAELIVQMEGDGDLKKRLDNWKNYCIRDNPELEPQLSRYGCRLLESAAAGGEECRKYADQIMDTLVREFKGNAVQQAVLDTWVTKQLEVYNEQYRSQVTGMVREQLQQFTDERLSEFVESKVGDDLQMIRINGSLMGGIAGMLLFVLTYWLERLW